MMTHIVTRAFDAAGVTLDAGHPVDASSWKNTERLVKTGYLRVASDDDRANARPRKRLPVPADSASVAPKRKFTIRKSR